MTPVKLPFYARLALSLLAVVIIIFLMSVGSSVFIPLFFAMLISMLLYPLAIRLERLGLGRGPAAFICVVLFLTFLALFIYFFTVQVLHFSKDIPELQSRIQLLIADLQRYVEANYNINAEQQLAYVNQATNSFLATAAHSAGSLLLSLTGVTIFTIFVFIYTFFMLHHRTLLRTFILALFVHHHKPQVNMVVDETRSIINSYVLGLLTEMAVMAVLTCSVFAILGLRYALLLGVLAAVLNIIPYLGIYTAMAIGMVVTLSYGTGGQALQVGVALIIIHFIDANILLPRIVGGRVKMNPLITIIAVLTGHHIWGIAGMFLFIPLTAILKIIFQRVKSMQAWAILIGTEEKKSPGKGPSDI